MTNENFLYFADFSFATTTKELYHKGQIVHLQPKHAELLAYLVLHRGSLVTREQIQQNIWPGQVLEFDQSINYGIKCIRRALEDDSKNPRFIQTVSRRGYRFIADIGNTENALDPNKENPKSSVKYPLALLTSMVLTGLGILWLWQSQIVSPQATIAQTNHYEASSDDFKRALFVFNKADYFSRIHSRELFEKAINKHPDEALNPAFLSINYAITAQSAEDLLQAKKYFLQAQELEGADIEKQMAEGMLAFYDEWNVPKARRIISQVAKKAAHWPLAWHELAVAAVVEGKEELALASIEQLLNLDPGAAQEKYHAGWFYMATRQWAEALKQCQQAAEINPQHHSSLICAGDAARILELHQVASDYYIRVVEDLASAEDKATIVEALREHNYNAFFAWFLEFQKGYNAGPFSLALTYASMSDYDNALQQLRLAREQRAAMLPTAWVFPEFHGLRNNDTFKEIMAAVRRG